MAPLRHVDVSHVERLSGLIVNPLNDVNLLNSSEALLLLNHILDLLLTDRGEDVGDEDVHVRAHFGFGFGFGFVVKYSLFLVKNIESIFHYFVLE